MIEASTRDRFPFPAVDLKFLNRGATSAVLWQVGIDVVRAEQDLSPDLSFEYESSTGDYLSDLARRRLLGRKHVAARERNPGSLIVRGTNDGWGAAETCNLTVSQLVLDQLFDMKKRTFIGNIAAATTKALLLLDIKDADVGAERHIAELVSQRRTVVLRLLAAVRAARLATVNDDDWRHLREVERRALAASNEQAGRGKPHKWAIHVLSSARLDAVPLMDLNVRGTYRTSACVTAIPQQLVQPIEIGEMWLASTGFEFERHILIPSALHSDTAYVCIMDPMDGPVEKQYPISREIPAGHGERFHVVVGATRSSYLWLRFKFYFDGGAIIESDRIQIRVRRRSKRWQFDYDGISDGTVFTLADGVWTLTR